MANLIECPTCKQQVSSNATVCPHCGETIKKTKCRSVKGGFIALGTGILLGVILCWVGGFLGHGSYSVHPVTYLGVIVIIGGIIGACIGFTTPSK